MLPVALGHFDDFRSDSNELATTVLHAVPAALAHRQGYLIARASSVPRSFEYLAAKEQNSGILVERFAGVAPDFRHSFAKGCERLARQVEPKHMALRAHVGRVIRTASRAMSRNQ